jgi:hypothetical protein
VRLTHEFVAGLQVYKAVRAGVQDVAVKFLHRTNAEDLQKFIEVRVLHRTAAVLLPCSLASLLFLLSARSQLAVRQPVSSATLVPPLLNVPFVMFP